MHTYSHRLHISTSTRQSDAHNFISGMFMYIRILTNLSIYYVHTCRCNAPPYYKFTQLITPLVGYTYLEFQITYKYFTRQSDAYNFISGMCMYIRILTNLSVYYVVLMLHIYIYTYGKCIPTVTDHI